MGLSESALNQLIRAGYGILRLITFYTTVGTELRAWTLPAGNPCSPGGRKNSHGHGKGVSFAPRSFRSPNSRPPGPWPRPGKEDWSGWKARNTSFRTATSCTSGSMSEDTNRSLHSLPRQSRSPSRTRGHLFRFHLHQALRAPPLVISAYRLGIAGFILALFHCPAIGSGIPAPDPPGNFFALFAGLFLSLHFAFWITSLKYTSVASSVIFVTTNPIFVALASVFFLRERLTFPYFFRPRGRRRRAYDRAGRLGSRQANRVRRCPGPPGGHHGHRLSSGGEAPPPENEPRAYITLVYGVAGILLILFALFSGDSFLGILLQGLFSLRPARLGSPADRPYHRELGPALFFRHLGRRFYIGRTDPGHPSRLYLLGGTGGPHIFLGGTLVLLGIYLPPARKENCRILLKVSKLN